MKIISLVAQKGGVGKTTIAIHLATAFAAEGRSTLILDLDPQASATEWKDHRVSEFPAVLSIQPSRLGKVVQEARGIGTDILLLDTAPHSEGTALEAMRIADLVLTPCQPTIMDLRALVRTADLLKLVKSSAWVVLNNALHQGSVTDEAAQTISENFGMKVAPVRFGDRVAYSRCMITGQAAQEVDPTSKAAQEVHLVHKWVSDLLHLPSIKKV